MSPKIVAVSSPPLRQRYEALLKSDLSLTNLDSIIALLWDQIKDTPNATTYSWWTVLQPFGKETLPRKSDPFVVDRIRSTSEMFHVPSLPSIPQGFTGIGTPDPQAAHIAMRLETAWTYLVLPILTDITGARPFLLDTMSALFICTIDYVLSAIPDAFIPEKATLANAAFVHTVTAWQDNPAHQYYLQSLVMDYLQRYDARFECLKRSFLLTPVEDHSYLTKAQALWSDLFDFQLYGEAEKFLLDLYRNSSTSHLGEVREMIHSMYTAAPRQW
jgi:hypothetical protein